MELDKNLPDTVLQDEDTQNGQNLFGSQIVHNMFILDMPQPLYSHLDCIRDNYMLLCTYTVSQCIQMLAINSQMYATSVTFMCIQL